MISRERITGWLSPLLEIVMRRRVVVKFVLHLAIFCIAYALAFLVRFDFSVPSDYVAILWMTIPVALVAKALRAGREVLGRNRRDVPVPRFHVVFLSTAVDSDRMKPLWSASER